eukprot:308334-Chlamydomonas_euryale.AAC.1
MAEESWQQLLKMCWALPCGSGKEGSGRPGWHRKPPQSTSPSQAMCKATSRARQWAKMGLAEGPLPYTGPPRQSTRPVRPKSGSPGRWSS